MIKSIFIALLVASLGIISSGKTYTPEELTAANFLAQKNIIYDWSKIPPRYGFDKYIGLVDTINIAFSLYGIEKNKSCRGDFREKLSLYTDELCRTFETAKDRGIFDLGKENNSAKISPLKFLTYGEFIDIIFQNKKYDDSDHAGNLSRGDAFVLLYEIFQQNNHPFLPGK